MQSEKFSAITIGNFDGLHLGHQKIISTLKRESKKSWEKIAITFYPHPLHLIKPEKSPKMLFPIEKRVETLEKMGLDRIIVVNTNRKFLNLSSEEFCNKFLIPLNPKIIVIGKNFKFGKNRSGDVKFLERFFKEKKTKIIGVSEERYNGKVISSTWIRELLKKGNLPLANKLLGSEYEIEGIVVKGNGIGRKLGFKTANLYTEYSLILSNGVYITETEVENNIYKSITNIGLRPTVEKRKKEIIETHILDFDRDIYDKKIKIKFLKKLRNEEKFENLEALKSKIKSDIEKAKKFFEVVKYGN